MNFALNEFPGLSDIPITSAFTQTKTVFHLSANLRIMFLSQCDCLQMAAWLIEQCGWKGFRDGNVGVHDRQPLVLVNLTGKASPDEIIALEKKIIASVYDIFGIGLHPEVEHI